MGVGSVAVLAATCLALGAGCGPDDGTPATSDGSVEFVLHRFGGLCPGPDGGGALCRFMVVVRDDGTWSDGGDPAPAAVGGTVRIGAASELASIFDDGWDALTARAFTDTCPTAYDGMEVTYAVRRLPRGPTAELADADIREVRSCTHDLSHRAARVVLDRISALWRELGLPE